MSPTSSHVTIILQVLSPAQVEHLISEIYSADKIVKSVVYSSDCGDAIVESVLLLIYNVGISLDCLLPADLATYLSIYLLGYQLTSVLVSQASCHEIKKGEATMTGTPSVDGTDL